MTLYGYISILLTALAIGVPIYLVIFRRRFWFAALISWLLLVVSQQFAVLSSLSTDTTTVGLTLFSGWLLSVPFCGLLLLIRLLLNRIGLLPALTSGRDLVDGGDVRQEGEQDVPPNA
jgi:hypothetical protein